MDVGVGEGGAECVSCCRFSMVQFKLILPVVVDRSC